MRATPLITTATRGVILLALVAIGMARTHGQEELEAGTSTSNTWERYDWLKPADDAQKTTASNGETFHASVGQDVNDPFAVLSSGLLYQEKYGAGYSRQVGDMLSLSCETSAVVMGDDSENLSNGEKVGFQFKPMEQLTFRGDVHDVENDAAIESNSTTTTGAAFSTESHLPLNNAVLTLGVNTDHTMADVPTGVQSQTNAYDVQWKQPLGKLPVSAILKGHYEGATSTGTTPTSIPSLEQSLEWKPAENTTIQAGLRQQQYQEYPGVDHQLNEALFADWSQKVIDNVSWHSYAEVLNSKGLLDQAPASPIATGTNGTPQATNPASTTSPTSSIPLTIDDQTLTFSTGPSFKLQKDISASVEYSNRWDKNPAPGSIGQEQRVSVSLKGTF
jgi:hypothetical protein